MSDIHLDISHLPDKYFAAVQCFDDESESKFQRPSLRDALSRWIIPLFCNVPINTDSASKQKQSSSKRRALLPHSDLSKVKLSRDSSTETQETVESNSTCSCDDDWWDDTYSLSSCSAISEEEEEGGCDTGISPSILRAHSSSSNIHDGEDRYFAPAVDDYPRYLTWEALPISNHLETTRRKMALAICS